MRACVGAYVHRTRCGTLVYQAVHVYFSFFLLLLLLHFLIIHRFCYLCVMIAHRRTNIWLTTWRRTPACVCVAINHSWLWWSGEADSWERCRAGVEEEWWMLDGWLGGWMDGWTDTNRLSFITLSPSNCFVYQPATLEQQWHLFALKTTLK